MALVFGPWDTPKVFPGLWRAVENGLCNTTDSTCKDDDDKKRQQRYYG